ncbi:MAG: RNA polymerase sigma factor [Gammaproteobacteria bacterium]|nr:RNA polymerase sigma factor [Gammaproteobacteria bacterium]
MSVELEIPQDVLQRCCQRDRAAFQQLVEQLKRPAYYHALALSGHAEDAMDISQEAFIRAWQSISKFRPGDPFYPWYYTILKRVALNVLRSRQRRAESSLEELAGEAAPDHDSVLTWTVNGANSVMSPELTRISEQTSCQVNRALRQLSVDEREIICLKDMQDYAYKDIAMMLSIPVGTVMSRLYTARTRLRQKLVEVGYEQEVGYE